MSDLRQALVAAVVAHQRKDAGGCICGWSELGRSWAEHVVEQQWPLIEPEAEPETHRCGMCGCTRWVGWALGPHMPRRAQCVACGALGRRLAPNERP